MQQKENLMIIPYLAVLMNSLETPAFAKSS